MSVKADCNVISKTLVIPTYNRADLIAETIESALAQEVPFSEIIIVDDGSTDDTAAVIARYGRRVNMIRTANAGVQAARNTGVNLAQTDYVTLCDSDDLLQPDFSATVAPWLAHHGDIDILYANFKTFDARAINPDKFSLAPKGWFDGAKSDGAFLWDVPDLYIRTVAYQPLFPTGVTFKKKFYQKIDGFNTRFKQVAGEDWEFTLRAIAAGRVGLCSRPLTRIRKHAGNDSGDLVKLLIGEAAILEHALATTAVAREHAGEIRSSIESRRVDAFNSAFALGDFVMTDQILKLLVSKSFELKFQLKKLIASLPFGIRDRVWRLTQ